MTLQTQPISNPISPLVEIPRGVSPKILIEQVKNTAPFIFDWKGDLPPYLLTLQKTEESLKKNPEIFFNHEDYYRLCVSAHWATVATFVPTDVDNQIRFKLWHPTLSIETILEMAKVVEESLHWPVSLVSTRIIRNPSNGFFLSGHNGEWFSIAVGAYGALRKKAPEKSKEIASLILKELKEEEAIFLEFSKLGDEINLLRSCAMITHNLGDLLRVFEMWNISDDDVLKTDIHKMLTNKSPLSKAGVLYKLFMAVENHRHFALRKPKALRKNSDFLLPIAPFLEDWGRKIANHPEINDEGLSDIAEALIDGWVYLKGEAVGYARALHGIEEKVGLKRLEKLLPSRLAKTLKTGMLRNQIAIPQNRFEISFKKSLSAIE